MRSDVGREPHFQAEASSLRAVRLRDSEEKRAS